MKSIRLFLSVLFIAFISCKKQSGDNPPTSPPPQPVLLKDIQIPHLPSPYYHFEYDPQGKAILASFASGYYIYHITYNGGRITEMRNDILVNQDRLQYFYNNEGNVSSVTYADSLGSVYTKVSFSYDAGKLVKVERERKIGADFIKDKILTMFYYPDGNLFELHYHYLPVAGQQEWLYADRFEQYDSKVNVDGFGLLHNEFFDHVILLPETPLQKNNPGKETRTGDGVNYTVNYTYIYNQKNQPLSKNGDLLMTSGADSGKHFQISSMFSYYE